MLVAKRCLIRNSLPRVSRSSSSSVQRNLQALLKQKHPLNNIPAAIESKIGRNLHLLPNHPLNIIKKKIERYCNDYASNNNQSPFAIYDSESPVADVKSCFDDLLVPPGHCSRSRSDTYYLTDELVFRSYFIFTMLIAPTDSYFCASMSIH